MESRPRKISVPRPAARSPGTSTSTSIGPPRPEASSSRNAPGSGEPSSELMAAKLPVAAITAAAVGGASRAVSLTASTPSPLPMRINGASGPSTAPKASVASAASSDAGELGRRQRPRRLEAVGGRVAAGPREVADRERGEQPREREQRQRPPHRRRVEPEGLRQIGEDGLLQPVDEREEPVRGGGDGHARQARRARAAGRSCGSSAAPEGPAEARGPAPLESSPAARAGRHLHRVIRGSRRSGGMPPSPAPSCRRAGDAPARAIAGPPAGWDGPPHDPPADRRRPRPHALRHRLR